MEAKANTTDSGILLPYFNVETQRPGAGEALSRR